MKIVLYFILYVLLAMLLIFLNSYFLAVEPGQLISSQRLDYIKFLLWRILPFLVQLGLMCLSLQFAKKLYFGVIKRAYVLTLHVMLFIIISLWAWSHGERIEFWNVNRFSSSYLRTLDLNELKIYHDQEERYHGKEEEKWHIAWKDNLGELRYINIGNSSKVEVDISKERPLNYSNIITSNKSNVVSDIGKLYTEVVNAFFVDPLFGEKYSNLALRILLYVSIGILASMNTLLLGLFMTNRDTVLSLILSSTVVSVGFLLLLPYPLYLALTTIAIYAIALSNTIRKVTQERGQGK